MTVAGERLLKSAKGMRAVERLRALQSGADPEAEHSAADDVLTDLLKSLGYEHVVAEWEKVEKWYA